MARRQGLGVGDVDRGTEEVRVEGVEEIIWPSVDVQRANLA